ncbi:MAG: spore coat protein CotJB [Erysipelotrichales bacterium]|nr:spore coat protein CotJB [Erysipelotrichales bacterium]
MELAQIFVKNQPFENLFTLEEGFYHGSVFKDLFEFYKFMPKANASLSKKERILEIIRQYEFRLLDLNLYLDTHPDSTECFKMINQTKEELQKVRNFYETNLGLISNNSINEHINSWISGPWPWEKAGNN